MKTIGDAVMAVFSHPTDALAAALDILEEIGRFNREHGGPAIVLKIGDRGCAARCPDCRTALPSSKRPARCNLSTWLTNMPLLHRS